MFKILCIVAALVAACSAAPSPPAGLYYQSTPLLAKYAPAPLAPASTVHAAHVAAALAPQTLYAASAPLATYAYAAPALAYDSGYSYTYAAGAPIEHAIKYTF